MYRLPSKEKAFIVGSFLVGRVARIAGRKSERPLLIVGTGRCGTSLLVRMLNSHPDISGIPIEANELWHPRLEPFESSQLDSPPIEINPKGFTENSLANWPEGHIGRIRDTFLGFDLVTGRAKVFFAKSAMISFLIPRILDALPDARFVHVYRYGPAVVESYFKKNFGKYSRYIFSESDYRLYCARYWNDCIVEIDKRRRDLSVEKDGSFFELSYERLCDSPREVLGDMAGFLDVDPDAFGFDTTRIFSRNYKVANNANQGEYEKMMSFMAEGMKLKGYKPNSF